MPSQMPPPLHNRMSRMTWSHQHSAKFGRRCMKNNWMRKKDWDERHIKQQAVVSPISVVLLLLFILDTYELILDLQTITNSQYCLRVEQWNLPGLSAMAVVLNHIPGGPSTVHILHVSFVWHTPISSLWVSTNEQVTWIRCVWLRVYSPNNFKFMLLRNALMLCVWTLVFVPQ